MKFDFETWLRQNYGIRSQDLNKRELALAKREYAEEYPEPGESEIRLKTYPFKKYLDSKG
ncbi:MAG: hypothetical protein JW880_07165 [Candidatus Thermoplasmatota archaeon]|nr:hypothetical protein [Candidatus Thermoplasmatota archaeon]